jgi:hypothetical protein
MINLGLGLTKLTLICITKLQLLKLQLGYN